MALYSVETVAVLNEIRQQGVVPGKRIVEFWKAYEEGGEVITFKARKSFNTKISESDMILPKPLKEIFKKSFTRVIRESKWNPNM